MPLSVTISMDVLASGLESCCGSGLGESPQFDSKNVKDRIRVGESSEFISPRSTKIGFAEA